MKKIVALLSLVVAFCFAANAAYLTNVPQTLIQPNGDTLHCYASGDEFYHWLHDTDGYTIVQNRSTGYYVYADKVDDSLVPTQYVAGTVSPAAVGLQPFINISASKRLAMRQVREAAAPVRNVVRDGEVNHGRINNVVIFIRFADDSPFTTGFESVERMFNDSVPGNSSMYNYFKTVSYNQLKIVSSFYPTQSGQTVLSYQDTQLRSYFEPYSVTNPNGYDENDDEERCYREHALLARAVAAVADLIPSSLDIDYDDDGYVDNVVFVVRGGVGEWASLLWPHRWCLYNEYASINGLRVWDFNFQLADASSYFNTSVLCHEMNHSLGAPDLYHYYEGTDLSPVGRWDLMEQTANPPQNMGAYMKYRYGNWIDDIPEITECGIYSLHSLGSSATNNCYKIASPNPNEFFVLEYRNKHDSFETQLRGSGLLVYRINNDFEGNAYYDGVSTFDEVYIYRPSGTTTEDGYVDSAAFSANSGRTAFDATTNPYPFLTDGSIVSLADFSIYNVSETGDTITFTFCAGEFLLVTPDELLIDGDSASTGTFSISSDMSWNITSNCDWLAFSPSADSASAVVMVTALSDNMNEEARACTLTITASNGIQRQVVVSQRSTSPYLVLDAGGNEAILYHQSSTCTVEVTSNVEWTASVDAPWLSVSPESGSRNGTLVLTALSENNTCIDRLATLTVTDGQNLVETVSVRQYHFAQGMMSVYPQQVSIENEIDSTVSVVLSSTDEWEVQSCPAWLAVSPSSGAYGTDVTFSVTALNPGSSRTGTVVFSDVCGHEVSVMVQQAAARLRVSPDSVSLSAEQGSEQTVAVTAPGLWTVLVSNIPDWLDVFPHTGTGNSDVTIRALSANELATDRTCTLTFRDADYSVELFVLQRSVSGIVDVCKVVGTAYPNPVSDVLTLPVDEPCTYVLYEVSGREVMRGTLLPESNQLSLTSLTAGTYFIRIVGKNENEISAIKIVKR